MTDGQDVGRGLMVGGGGQGWLSGGCGGPVVPSVVDASVPHVARMYDYLLGGRDNYEEDREAAERALAVVPYLRRMARSNRACMRRMVRYLAGEAGLRQFLDIGTGLPTSPNLHEVAQGIDPSARVLYVDHDPTVLAHAQALLISHPQGRTGYVRADLRDVGRILAAPEFAATLDLSRPVALTLIAVLHFISDGDDPGGIIARLMDALPAGSCLAVTHVTGDLAPEEIAAGASEYRRAGHAVFPRTRDEVAALFARSGLELVSPGVEVITRWRPGVNEISTPVGDARISCYGAVGVKRDGVG